MSNSRRFLGQLTLIVTKNWYDGQQECHILQEEFQKPMTITTWKWQKERAPILSLLSSVMLDSQFYGGV